MPSSTPPDAKQPCFHRDNADYYIHISTGSHVELDIILGVDYANRYDAADLAQLKYVITVCRASSSAADAAKKLYAVSRHAKSSTNDSDRLTKYLARFGLKFRELSRST